MWDGTEKDLDRVLNGDKPTKSGKWRDGYYSNEPYNLEETDIADEDDKAEVIRERDEQQQTHPELYGKVESDIQDILHLLRSTHEW